MRFRRSPLRAKARTREPDWWLLAIVLTLALFGTVMVYSSTAGLTSGQSDDAFGYLARQLVFLTVGIGVMLIAMNVDYHRWRPLAFPGLVVVAMLLLAVLLMAGDINGSKRWFDLGPVHLQPSELAKPILIVYLASWLGSQGDHIKSLFFGMGRFVVVMAVIIGLIFLEPDLGTSVLLATVGATMFFVAGGNIRQIIALIFGTGTLFVMLALAEPYRRARVLAFLDPESNIDSTGWHLLQARYALGDGGLFGVGLGASRQKFTWLPAPHNDAIFAVIGEELGLIGAAFVLVLFGLLAYRGFRVARRAPDHFGSYIAVGITTWFTFQALFNIGGVTSSIPFTGITLPFISYGGSSLMVTFAALGVLLNISRQAVDYPQPGQQTGAVRAQPETVQMHAKPQQQTANWRDETIDFEPVGNSQTTHPRRDPHGRP